MVIGMIENVYPVTNKGECVAGRSRTLPRNIRACGGTGGVLPVYIEDYVGTYIRRLTESGFPECSAVILVGQVMETEIGCCLFVKGAIRACGICEGDHPTFGEDIWNEIYEKIRMYFPYDEVVGWCIAGPGFHMLQEEVFLRVHIDNFADSEKIFCCYESLEKELTVRICEGGSFRILPGYCIYYEKNDEMQNYMLADTAEMQTRPQEAYHTKEDKTARKSGETEGFEEVQKRKGGSLRKDIMQLAAIACIIILIVSVMVGTDTLEKLKKSVFAAGEEFASDESQKGEQNGTGDVPERSGEEAGEENPEELAFGNFDFLNKKEETEDEGKAEEIKVGQVSQSKEEQEETTQTGQKEAEQETTEQTNQKEAEQEMTAQTGQSEAEQEKTAQVGQIENEQGENAQVSQNEAEQEETEDPDRIEEETVTVLSPSEYTRYIVKAGDTLAQICKEVYGSVELLHYVCELNQLKDIDSIYAGQELILPKK